MSKTRIPYLQSCKEYNFRLQKFEARVESKTFSILDYSRKDITKKIIQRIVELSVSKTIRHIMYYDALDTAHISYKNILTEKGDISLEKKLYLVYFLKFLFFWARVSFSISMLFFQKKTCSTTSACLLSGLGKEHIYPESRLEKFIAFCKQGPIAPLRQSPLIICQKINKEVDGINKTIVFSDYPLIELLEHNIPNFGQIPKLLIKQLALLPKFIITILNEPFYALLAKDVAFHELANYLNSRALIDSVVLTNGDYANQPLWTRVVNRSFDVHMVYYSHNNLPMISKSDNAISIHPSMRLIDVDVHWIWTEWFSKYYAKQGVAGTFKVVGPILFSLPKVEVLHKTHMSFIQLTVFDLNPFTDEYRESIGMGGYWSKSNMIKFIKDLVFVREKLKTDGHVNLKLKIKSKREFNIKYDQSYIELLISLQEANILELLTYEADVFDLINESDIVLSIPYTSTAIIASYSGKHSIYYDATQDLIPEYDTDSNIVFLAGSESLYQHLKLVSKRFIQ